MKSTSIFQEVTKGLSDYAAAREQLISLSNFALTRAKRAIFAYHRDDESGAEKLLSECKDGLSQVQDMFGSLPSLEHEGAYRAALEEYAEALLFAGFLKDRDLVSLKNERVGADMYVAGMCDATGEVLRWATLRATAGNMDDVNAAADYIENVVEFLVSTDLTGYLRTKADQAKKRLPTIERMMYDLSLHK